MKAFISQPMTGLTKEEIEENRKRAREFLEAKGYEVIESLFDLSNVVSKNVPLKALGMSIMALAEADVIYVMQGYQHAKGCLVELQAAQEYGVAILFEQSDQ